MAKYKLTIEDNDEVLINTIPTQPKEGYEEGTKVTINVKFGPHGNLFGAINGGEPTEIIPKAVFEVVMDENKNVVLTSTIPPTDEEVPEEPTPTTDVGNDEDEPTDTPPNPEKPDLGEDPLE